MEFQGVASQWFKSYLNDGNKSWYKVPKFKPVHLFRLDAVKYGVPEGSVLGLLLFLTSVIYLTCQFSIQTHALSNDTSVVVCYPEKEHVQNYINVCGTLKKLFTVNKLTLNIDKNKFHELWC